MAVLGVHADGVDGAVHADPGGQPAQGLDRILALEVDHFGALLAGHVQAVRVAVDGEHPGGAEQRAGDGELAHRTAAEHGDGVAGGDTGQFGAEVTGGEDVRQEYRLVVADAAGQADQADVGIGNPRFLGLQPMEAAVGPGPPKNAVPAWLPPGLATSHWA